MLTSRLLRRGTSIAQIKRAVIPAGCRSIAALSVEDLTAADLEGKRVFVRADLNTPLTKEGARVITDDTRIVSSMPTINHLVANGAQVVLASHLGRPKSGPEVKFNLEPVAVRLSELLGQEITYCSDCIGESVSKQLDQLKNGQVALLENVRFHKEETKNDPAFAEQLAHSADIFVNDAFGAAHRAHASTAGVANFIPQSAAGMLMKKEIDFLIGAVEEPARPFAAVVGGSKVSTKITVLRSLMDKCDTIIVGGGMVFTFFKAQGGETGQSLVEEDQVELAGQLLEEAAAKGVKLLLPTDIMAADKFAADAKAHVVPAMEVPEGWMGLDIGPDSIAAFSAALGETKTIVWNGPMGVFEFDSFAAGTKGVANCMADLTAQGVITIVGGGDSVAAVQKYNLGAKMSHISTGGGASLELLEGKVLPGVACLDTK